MPLPLVLLHGYSSSGEAFYPLRNALKGGAQRDLAEIFIGNYVSLNNEITIKDLAEGLDRAFRAHPLLKNEEQAFDAVVHSTGMLVLRAWMAADSPIAEKNKRLRRVRHLVGLAPATWGSPQAHKGRTWLGALVKGNRELGPDFLNAGDCILDGLELGSKFTWDLAHRDLLGPQPFYDSTPATPFVAVFIGNQAYEGLQSVANEPGTDGTVRWSGCGLNTRKIVIDLTREPQQAPRAVISPWASTRLDVPILPIDGRNHSTIVADPPAELLQMMLEFLAVNDSDAYGKWLDKARQETDAAKQAMLVNPGHSANILGSETERLLSHLVGKNLGANLDGWQQFVVHVRDANGDGVSDYLLDVLTQKEGNWTPFEEMYTDVHAYKGDASYRCFHIRLPLGLATDAIPLRVRLHASTGTDLMAYQGYGAVPQQLTGESLPVELDLGDLGGNNGSLFHPFTTTLIEIVLNREPLPFHEISPIFGWVI